MSLSALLACALLGGALQALAFAAAPGGMAGDMVSAWPGWRVASPGVAAYLPGLILPGLMQIAGVTLLMAAIAQARSVRRAALAGSLFGTVWLAGSVWWLYISMHRYGGLPSWMAGAAVLLLTGALSLFQAVAAAAWARWRRGGWGDVLLWSALWLLAELVRARWLTGFPWAASGYAHVDGPLAAWAPYIGVYGMGAVSAAVAALLVRAAGPGQTPGLRLASIGAVAVLCFAPRVLPANFSMPTGTLSVALIQGNVPQDEKFDPTHLPAVLDWHLGALDRASLAGADLVVAAETAIPLLPSQMPDGFWQALQRRYAERPGAVLFGVPLGDFDEGYTNSVIGLGNGIGLSRPAYRYDKHHLVPFGEVIPTGFHWFVAMMNIPLGDFNRGPLVAPSMPVRGERVAPNICYEDLFGEELAARFTDPAQAPTVLANVSNIGWFGHSVAISQHLQISRLRTLELQRPMVRATNTGATVVIDHQGVVRAALAPDARDVLTAHVEGRQGTTPYATWAGRWGTLPLWLLALAAVVGAVVRQRREIALTC